MKMIHFWHFSQVDLYAMTVQEFHLMNKLKRLKIRDVCLEFKDQLENNLKLFNKILFNAQI